MTPFQIAEETTLEQLQLLCAQACQVGMSREVLHFPFVEKWGEAPLPIIEEGESFPTDKTSATKAALSTRDFKIEGCRLETWLQVGSFLLDEDNDGLPDTINFHYVLPSKVDASLTRAIVHLTTRIAMDVTSIDSRILFDLKKTKNCVRFIEGPCMITHKKVEDHEEIIVQGSGKELEEFVACICENFDGDFNLPLDEFTWQINHPSSKETEKPKKIFEKEYEVPDEVQQCYAASQKLPKDASGLIECALSKPIEVRQKVQTELQKQFPKATVHVGNTYKPGFSWIEEVCLPACKDKNCTRIEIAFKPCLEPGVSSWNDEDGAVPKRGDTTIEKKGWLELPIRYLQELYPIDDILAQELSLDISKIHFSTYEGSEEITYLFQAFHEEECIYENRYYVETKERYYLDAYPEAGTVHPSCNVVRYIEDGKILQSYPFLCERDEIWKMYQSQTLPALKELLLKEPSSLKQGIQPLFSCLTLSIGLDETDRDLPCRQDRIAPIDALQEDIYFTTLDYMKYLGKELLGKALDAPGLILPDVRKVQGPATFKVEVTAAPKKEKTPWKVALTKVTMHQGQLLYQYEVEGDAAKVSKKVSEDPWYNSLWEKDVYLQFGEEPIVHLKGRVCEKNRTVDSITIPKGTVLGYEQVVDLLLQFEHIEGVDVIPLAKSVQHRIVYGIQLRKPQKGYVSKVKAITNHPSFLLDCRHHANEVSSTTSCFLVLKTILENPKEYEHVWKSNHYFIPMENPDGAAIHDQLQQINPTNKLHVARYNSLGKEFAHETFAQDTIHTEARGMFRCYRQILPDLIIDDHGVPSHEWEQPYSGYTSPAFKGFWLPRSILYGYFWTTTNPEYSSNQDLCYKIEEAIADAMEKEEDCMAENREWIQRFETYAHAWMPKLFPAEYERNMIQYWIAKSQDANNLYPSQRFPWITTTYYTSEVADETAQGEYLDLCAKTHVVEDCAILRLLKDTKQAYNRQYGKFDKGIYIQVQRQRPLLCCTTKR